MDVSYIFIAVEINIMYRNLCILYRNLHILYIQYMYTLQACISVSGIVIHYVHYEVVNTLSPKKYSFKWEFWVPSDNFCRNVTLE